MEYKKIIETTFNKYDGKDHSLLSDFYDLNVIFEDPAVQVQGLDSLKKYYEHAYSQVKYIRFHFHDFLTDDTKVAAKWTMSLQVNGLASGKEIKVAGMTLFRFNREGKVIYHRDYFDLGAMLYENLPLQGAVIRFIKGRLRGRYAPSSV